MHKLVWVALPLILAGAAVGVLWLVRHAPSRLALNAASSLLLLVYLAITAGLGIFWVANQQLPVFDWHYLFGYATVLLVALHLVLNFRVVWRYLVRRVWRRSGSGASAAADADAEALEKASRVAPARGPGGPGAGARVRAVNPAGMVSGPARRRALLAWGAGALTSGAAYLAGRLHGRHQGRLEGQGGALGSTTRQRAAGTSG